MCSRPAAGTSASRGPRPERVTGNSRTPVLAQPVSLEDHADGYFRAPLTIVQYGDYECPYTRQSRLTVRTLQSEFQQRMLFVFRHFPVDAIHAHAHSAAAAAEAAAAQGSFWTMHEYLFEHQHALEPRQLVQYARDLGLDLDRFERDRSSAQVARRISRDLSSGKRSGVNDTPAFFTNGLRHTADLDIATLRAAVLSALDQSGG
ncbi:MAG: thioredoxin domain-containing protein [Chloroflexi bacterium]|nr:thioredoxin domain-containing protein [Chloroflexota bacterium]